MGRRRGGGMARSAARRTVRSAARPVAGTAARPRRGIAGPDRRRPGIRRPGKHWHGKKWPRRRGWGAPWPVWPDVIPLDDGTATAGIDDLLPGEPTQGEGLSPAARRSLARLGLLRGVWPERLRTGGPALAAFLNRFHAVAGVGRVVEDYFASPYARAAARMAIRLSERLATRSPGFRRELHYDRRIAFAPDGQPILAIVVGHRGVHYRLLPWRRLHAAAMRRQARRDRVAFGSPDRVRWVFDRRLMTAPPGRVRADAGRILGNRDVAARLITLV